MHTPPIGLPPRREGGEDVFPLQEYNTGTEVSIFANVESERHGIVPSGARTARNPFSTQLLARAARSARVFPGRPDT